MFRIRFSVWIAALLLVVVPWAAAPARAAMCAPCTSASLSAEEQALWQQIVTARAAAGLTTLMIDASTTTLARDRSADMARYHLFGHTSSGGTTFLDLMPEYGLTWQLASETIERNDYADPAREAARGLIASPEHHAILFDSRYRIGGVGSAVGDDGFHYFTIIVIEP